VSRRNDIISLVINLFKRNYLKILIIIAALSAFLALISALQISQGNFAGFEPELYGFGYLYGSFIWGDLFIFALLWLGFSLILLKLKKIEYLLLALCSFWFVRSTGEALYWFIQQFNPAVQPWPQYHPRFWIFKDLSNKEFWVLGQIGWQSVAVLSLFGIIIIVLRLVKNHSK